MAKYYGQLGFTELVETSPGIWNNRITERSYYGDVIKNYRRLQNSEYVNNNIDISNDISIVADAYVTNNINTLLYATFMGQKWKVSSVDVQYPRLILSLGGLYHDDE